ncbi:hypothetical protein Ancab_011790 [Ancistrocladus abbreviatus]
MKMEEDAPLGEHIGPQKKMMGQLTGKRDDTRLHAADRVGDLSTVMDILAGTEEEKLKELLERQNQSGETVLYVAAEHGQVDVVNEMVIYYHPVAASIKARYGFDAFHIAAKQGDLARNRHLELVKALLEKEPGITTRTDKKGQIALHMVVKRQNLELVEELIKANPSSVNMADTKGYTPLHIVTRNGRAQGSCL